MDKPHMDKPHMDKPHMDKPHMAQRSPYFVDVIAGESYWWCACGKSKSQPFCDGSHKGSAFSPIEYKADKDGQAVFCGCKMSADKPLCDGSHTKL